MKDLLNAIDEKTIEMINIYDKGVHARKISSCEKHMKNFDKLANEISDMIEKLYNLNYLVYEKNDNEFSILYNKCKNELEAQLKKIS